MSPPPVTVATELTRLGVTLRDEVREPDLDAVRAIVESTGFFYPHEVEIAVELVHERLARGAAASGYHFVLAERDGRPLGYTCYGPIACTVGSFDLYWIVVHARERRRGLGRLLLRDAEERMAASAGRRVYVETSGRPQYEPTRRFYERSGYAREAVLQEFYGPGDDKIVYVKVLASAATAGT